MEEKAADEMEVAAQENEKREKAEKAAQDRINTVIFDFWYKFICLLTARYLNYHHFPVANG